MTHSRGRIPHQIRYAHMIMAAISAVLVVGSLASSGGVVNAAPEKSADPGANESWFSSAQLAGGSGAHGESVAVTSNGTSIITGYIRDTAYFPTSADDSIALTAQGSDDIFVAALNTDDSYFAWATSAGGQNFDVANSVAITANDTPIITGYFSGTAYFPTSADDSIALTAQGSRDIFVAALNADDSYFAWATSAGGQNFDVANSVAITANDTPIITGYIRDTAYFPTSADDSIALTAQGSRDMFVAALNTDDTYFAWATSAGGTGTDEANSVAITADDTPIITGYFHDTAYYPTAADDSIALTSQGNQDMFVAALNADDSYFAWAISAGGTGSDLARSVAITADDTPIITGYIRDTAYFPTSADDSIGLTSQGSLDIFVAALNTDDTYFAWATSAGGTDTDISHSVAITADDTPIITGYFRGTAYFPTSADDSIALTSQGFQDMFVAALNADDSYFAWATSAGGTGTDEANSVAIAADDTPIITGYFRGTAYFPTSADDSIALTSPSNDSVFVAWMGASSAPPTPPVPPTPTPVFPPSAPQSVTGLAGDSSATITWAAPASSGSFPVTNYQVVLSPGGQTCLTAASTVTCVVTGLTHGIDYTASVRALNGAGWGPYSAASNTFTPQPVATPSITITGTRGDVRGKPGIIVNGTAQDFETGTILTPWIRFPGQASYTVGFARILPSQDGDFTWQRRTSRKIYVSIRNADGSVNSNRLIIQARPTG